MYDFSLLPDDTVLTLGIALVLFAVAFVFFVVVAIYTLISITAYSKKHKDKLKLVCDVAYFHERGKRDNQEDSIYISPIEKVEESGLIAACSDGMGGLLNGEVVSKYVTDSLAEITEMEKELSGALKAMLGIYARVRLVSPKSITRSEGKAVRVIDKRKI